MAHFQPVSSVPPAARGRVFSKVDVQGSMRLTAALVTTLMLWSDLALKQIAVYVSRKSV